eukprot:scaffold115812_cov29-Tisochrysis_lutea.AAC.2
MPTGAILTATTDPRRADSARVDGRQTYLKATVAVEQRRIGAVQHHVLARNLEVGHSRPILGSGEVLRHRVRRGIEHVRQGLERLAFSAPVRCRGELQGRRREEAGACQPHIVRVFRPNGTDIHRLSHWDVASRRQLLLVPRAATGSGALLEAVEGERGAHVLGRLKHDVVAGPRVALQRVGARRIGLEQHSCLRPVLVEHSFERRSQECARRKLAPSLGRRPRRAEQEGCLVAKGADGRVVRYRHLAERRLVLVGRLAEAELVHVTAIVVDVLGTGNIALLDLEDSGGLRERRAAPPRLDDARVP